MVDAAEESAIAAHYGGIDLFAAILAALREAGRDADQPSLDDLAPIDHFHGGGRTATLQLLTLAGLDGPLDVLDIGGGLGGPARTLAQRTGSPVTVLDLSDEFVRTGELLTERLGMSEQVRFRQGAAAALPFADASFDLVWAQNSLMNVRAKERVYTEAARVLRPGGRFAFQDVLAGPLTPAHYPTAWAADASTSFLWTAAETREALAATGFSEAAWTDVSAEQGAARRIVPRMAASCPTCRRCSTARPTPPRPTKMQSATSQKRGRSSSRRYSGRRSNGSPSPPRAACATRPSGRNS